MSVRFPIELIYNGTYKVNTSLHARNIDLKFDKVDKR